MTPPAWVRKRDGRLVPFEADKISRSLFAATEELGRPDAFLARELTDGVLHFLPGDAEGGIPTTADVAELVTKVVRELGQPALARAHADFARRAGGRPGPKSEPAARGRPIAVQFAPDAAPTTVVADCLRAYSLGAVFARDLVAAHRDGLLTLAGLAAPLELAASAPAPPAPLVGRLLEARQATAGLVALDGVEHTLAASSLPEESAAAAFARELEMVLPATGLCAVLNLNTATAPAWADTLAEGPLFAGPRADDLDRRAALADALLQAVGRGPARVRIDWHLSDRDFAPAPADRLRRAARLAAAGAALAFVFDRPRRPVALAEGLDRRHPARLLTVGLHLPRLAQQPGLSADAALFLQKLGSLARLALSAAVQKRDFLRRHAGDRPALTRGFLLERARLLVAPVGLDAAVRLLTGKGLCDGRAPELGREIVRRLRDVLRDDGRGCLMDTCLDAPGGFTLDGAVGPAAAAVAGLTPWDGAAPVKAQLRAAGALHAVAEGGTAALLLAEDQPAGGEQVVEWLRWAWQQTDVGRVCLVRPGPSHQQLTLPVV